MANHIYALIIDGEVKDILVCDDYEMANYVARAAHGDQAIAVESTQYKLRIGDKFKDNKFWHVLDDGTETEAEYIPTPEQQVTILQAEAETLTESIIDNDYRLSMMELGL